MSVLIESTIGDFVVDLYVDERPNTCKNFLKLCKRKYYNCCQFFTIEPNYIAQTGDPTNTGRGGESVYGMVYGEQARYFEMEHIPKLKHRRKGLLSMTNNGNGMLGSQFFITLADELDFLDDKHCIFGEVTEGMEAVQALNESLVDNNNQPFKDIRISHTIIIDDPFSDPPRITFPSRSPSPTEDLIKMNSKIAIDQSVDEDADLDPEEARRRLEEKEMKAQAQILEMVGDLRHADDTPEDNVLFVCKLNPVTTDEDLEVIFSRFGQIVECEVIRDKRTKASLQYAFIRFEKPEYCEAAYLKMDNVLIDDRRIHVDFSQSVAKLYQWDKQDNKRKYPEKERRRSKSRSPKRYKHQEKERRRSKSRSPKRHKHREKERRRSKSRSPKRYKHQEKERRRSKSRSPKRHKHSRR